MVNDFTTGEASRAFHPGAFPTGLNAPLERGPITGLCSSGSLRHPAPGRYLYLLNK